MLDQPEVEEIKQQMDETRSSLVDKLESLEQHVVGTVAGTTAAVAETVANVKEAVQETVDAVKDSVHDGVNSVRRAVDLSHQVDEHPWLLMAGSIAVGYLGACLLGRTSSSRNESRGNFMPPRRDDVRMAASTYTNGASEASAANKAPGLLDGLATEFSDEINKIKALAIGTSLGLARDFIAQATPPALRPRVTEIIDSMTSKLGGEAVRGHVLDR